MGAFSVVLETVLSGKTALPFGTFLLMMQPIHLAIGIVEGFVTAGVINYVRTARPEILDSSASSVPLAAGISLRNVLIGFLALAIVTGGALSWFASTHPDGLEGSIKRITGKGELPEQEHGIQAALKSVQEKTSFFPGYGFKPPENEPKVKEETPSWPAVDAGTSVSGLIGGVMVLAMAIGIGWAIRALRGKNTP
jgi:cobalt/nickel transport system permease protein